MVASTPTIYPAVVTDQVYRAASHGNRLRRQDLASGKDRTRCVASTDLTLGKPYVYTYPTDLVTSSATNDPDSLITVGGGGSYIISIPHAGDYLASASLGCNTHSMTSGVTQLWIGVNGTEAHGVTGQPNVTGAGIYLSTYIVLRLEAGDWVQAFAATSALPGAPITAGQLSIVCVGW